MHITCYKLNNYRRLRDVYIELSKEISIFVGANNSGKTSATQALQMFLEGAKDRFSLYDFSSESWNALNAIGFAGADNDVQAVIPTISLDLWFHVDAVDLPLVIPILPSSDWEGNEVGIRIEFCPKNSSELLARFRVAKADAVSAAAALGAEIGSYVPWPASLSDFLTREMKREFEFRYFALDRARFNHEYVANPDYSPPELGNDPTGAKLLESLIRVDGLSAQRHLADPSTSSAGRAEDLSKRLSRFYHRHLDQRAADHKALKALFESEVGLNAHFMEVFEKTLSRVATLGYAGVANPKIEIKSAIDPASILQQNARVNYVLGNGADAVRLPDTYNGLGLKNLIYMVVEILDVHSKWQADEDRPPLHLIFIEEPEAHLHAQLQQVFIRNVLSLLSEVDADAAYGQSQVVVTTHSPHILYELGFGPIRYFRRHVEAGHQTTKVLNLSRFQAGPEPNDRDFLQRYLKLTHCDLFFADAAILVEGNVERLLLPIMIEKEASELRSAALTILEVGGAYGHRFKALIEFLGITTLIVTDIDSVVPLTKGGVPDEDEDTEYLEPNEAGEVVVRFGKKCLAGEPNAVTSNQMLIQWLPKKKTVADLWSVANDDKIYKVSGVTKAKVRVAYQTLNKVDWNGKSAQLCGRTLEEAFGLDNAEWCQDENRHSLGLKMRGTGHDTPEKLAAGLNKRVTGKQFDKTKFALGILAAADQSWVVPLYIKEGLVWLRGEVADQLSQEVVASALAEASIEGSKPSLGEGA